jgi:hypothetical protein
LRYWLQRSLRKDRPPQALRPQVRKRVVAVVVVLVVAEVAHPQLLRVLRLRFLRR